MSDADSTSNPRGPRRAAEPPSDAPPSEAAPEPENLRQFPYLSTQGLPEAPTTQAESQFPYTSTQGLQPAAAPSSRRRRTGRARWLPVLVAVAAALVGLAIIAVSVIYGSTRNPITPPPGAGAPPASTAVRQYLEALERADAPGALALAAAVPADRSLLTSDVLASSDSRLTDIDVLEGSNEPASQAVTASYSIGGRRVTGTFAVFRRGSDWRLGSVAAQVRLPRFGGLPLLVDGRPVTSSTVTLFPGSYTLGVDDPRYRLTSAGFVVDSPASTASPRPALALSDAARDEIAAAARALLKRCLAAVEFNPAGCGFGIVPPKGSKLDESTVTWRLLSGRRSLDDLSPALDRVGYATAAVDLAVRADVKGRDGSRWQATAHVTKVYADLSGTRVRVEFG